MKIKNNHNFITFNNLTMPPTIATDEICFLCQHKNAANANVFCCNDCQKTTHCQHGRILVRCRECFMKKYKIYQSLKKRKNK